MTTDDLLLAKILFPALLLFGCWSNPPTATRSIPEATRSIPQIAEIIEARDLDRGRVLDIKERFKPQDAEYQRARNLYRVAQARYDGWMTELAFDIGEGINRDPRTDQRYQDLSDAAARAANDFDEYVESLTARSKGVSSFVTSILDKGIKIWLSLVQEEQKKRKEVADFVAHLKWEPWESITAVPAPPEAKSKTSQ